MSDAETVPAVLRGPDGAKPGDSSRSASDRYAFDADGRAKSREDAPVTIGEVVYHRRRRNWAVTRDLRDLLRVQERAIPRSRRLQKQIEELPAETPEEKLLDLEHQQDVIADVADEAAYKIIVLCLRDEEGKSPTLSALQETMDVADAGELAAQLAGGGEPAEGPTGTPTS